MRVVDPACGSGHFLVAAARRIAKRLAAIRAGEDEPSPREVQRALRDVVGRCIYGVDLNPMAVELCKVSLWMEALEPGRPLSFLDSHIQCGNALLGATPALMARGIPDDAFKPIEGDDKDVARRLKKRNRDERKGQTTLFDRLHATPAEDHQAVAEQVEGVEKAADDSIAAIREKERRWDRISRSPEFKDAWFRADAWCAAFVWPKVAAAPRQGGRKVGSSEIGKAAPTSPSPYSPSPSTGFDVVLGNPPWEHIELKEKEFFAARAPAIAGARNAAARKKAIARLEREAPALWAEWKAALREADGATHLARSSGRYPLCARGRINTYSLFAELNRTMMAPAGRVGCIVPSGIATDATTQHFFRDLVESRSLVSFYDFENRKGIFPGVHRSYKFCLLTLGGPARPQAGDAEFAFFLLGTGDLDDERRFTLSADDIALLNPNTGTCPVFRSRRDAEITKHIYRRVPVLVREASAGRPEENPWGVSFRQGLFNMASDSGLFRTRGELEAEGWRLAGNVFERGREVGSREVGSGELGEGCVGRYLPLYEAKMVHHFDHRFGDYADRPADSQSTQLPEVPPERHADPAYAPLPRYWVDAQEVEDRLAGRWDRGWLLGWRDITNNTNERTVIAAVVPRVGVGHTTPIFMMAPVHAPLAACLLANLSAFVSDYPARQKIGGTHLTYNLLKQLPVLPPLHLRPALPLAPLPPPR